MQLPGSIAFGFAPAAGGDSESMPGGLLADLRFSTVPTHGDVVVPLAGPHGGVLREIWCVGGAVSRGRRGGLSWAEGDGLLFGNITIPEANDDAPREAASEAYAAMEALNSELGYPNVHRIWNFLSGINEGQGDAERYRRFCTGRLEGMRESCSHFPAATAVGFQQASSLQVYWLAARVPGEPIENPRQTSAYRYPREYGPTPPSFSRASLLRTRERPWLLISGTASVVGHATLHAGDVLAQLEETRRNLDAIVAEGAQHCGRAAGLNEGTVLKAYVRHAEHVPLVQEYLATTLPQGCVCPVLLADICRADLLVEIDGFHPYLY